MTTAAKKNLIFAALFLSVIFVIYSVTFTFAWFIKEEETTVDVNYGNMEIESEIYFESFGFINGAPDRTDPRNDYDGEFFYVKVMDNERNEPDYISNLRINIKYRGIGVSYIRVTIAESWQRPDGQGDDATLRNMFTKYIHNDTYWIDNRRMFFGGAASGGGYEETIINQNDGAFYFNYKVPLEPLPNNYPLQDVYSVTADPLYIYPSGITRQTSAGVDTLTIPLVTGFDSDFIAKLFPREGTKLKIKVLTETVQFNRYKQIWKLSKMPERFYTVTFASNYDAGTGDVITSKTQAVIYKDYAVTPPVPDAPVGGMVFGGWFTNKECTSPFNFSTVRITGNTTLYAKWS